MRDPTQDRHRRSRWPPSAPLPSGSLAGAAAPDLEQKIDSARAEAQLITQRIYAQSAEIAELQAARRGRRRARAGAARPARARAPPAPAELNDDLLAAEDQLEAVRARYKRAVGVLADRLVAIYKGSEPDDLTVILEADGFEELDTRAEYLEALTDADERIAERVSALHDEVDRPYEEIAELKAGIDEQARGSRPPASEIAAVRAEAEARAAEIADAKAEPSRPPSASSRSRSRAGSSRSAGRRPSSSAGAGEAFLGGPTRSPPTSSCASPAATTAPSTPPAGPAARTRSSPRPGAPTAAGPSAPGLQGRAGPHRRHDLARGRPRRLVLRLTQPASASGRPVYAVPRWVAPRDAKHQLKGKPMATAAQGFLRGSSATISPRSAKRSSSC